MKISKNIFICALLVLMLLCVNAVSAEATLDDTVGTDAADDAIVADAPVEELSASGDTFVVDANGGGDYTTISSAVSAATGGETIFVKNGEYSEANTITFTKSVSIVGESQDGVKITGAAKTLFGATTDNAIVLSFTNLTILNAGSGSNPAIKLTYCAHNLTLTDCTFNNCGSKFGTMQLGQPGNTIIDNCKILNSKETTSAGAGAIYISGAGNCTIKNSIIDNVTYTVSSSYMNGAIYVYSANAVLTIENTTISNITAPTRGVINTVGTVNIKGSKIQDNTLNQFSDSMTSHVIYLGDKGTANIEQSEISDNTCGSLLFNNYIDTSKLTVNYCNIHDNDASGTVNTLGTIDLEANWWGSSDKPADVTATTWVVEDNGEYKLNTGEALAKDIPGLTGGDEPGPQPTGYDVYVSPDGTGDGLSYENPTDLINAIEICPDKGSIFFLNGNYQLWGLALYKNVALVGESRDGVILTTVGQGTAFTVYDITAEEAATADLDLDFISICDMTFSEESPDSFLFVCSSVKDVYVINCVLNANMNQALVMVGSNVLGEPFTSYEGTLNFNNNIVNDDATIAAISIAGLYNANINGNFFFDEYRGENLIASNTEGTVNVDYNYWGSNDPATTLEYDDFIIATASSDAAEIYSDESAEITIAMTLSDGTTNAKDHLPDYPIEATLTATGDLSENAVTLQNGIAKVTYTSDVARSDNIRINVLGQTLTVPITVKERYLGPIYVATTGSDDNEGSENAPVATVAKAVELALANGGSGEIIINEGTYVGNGYHVTGDLTVTGNGKVTLDANNEGRFFYMNYGDTANKIELHNLILTNANGYGAAVYSFANELILDNVTIVNNQATGYLISSKGKLTIQDSEISKSMSGDVIQQTGNGDILINNTVFKDNSIVDSTSVMAVINLNSNSGNLVVENSKFINNTARQGVIKGNYNYNIDVKGTEFIDNTNTVSYGGAIYTSGGILNVADSVFVNNKAARSGGAIYVGYRSTATIDKSIFVNNVANTMDDDYYGDAIYDGNKLTVNNSVLLTNSNNGLIYSDGEDNVPYAQNCWWGTNDDPSSLNGIGYYEDDDWEEYDCPAVDVSNWATMDASFTPADAQAGDEVTVTATFSNANLPDGINVTFTSTSVDLITVVSTVDAQASTTYTIAEGDEAIIATSSNAEIVMPIAGNPFTTNIVTNDTFYNFFDEDGMLKETVPYDELIFQGSFSDLGAGYVIITKPVKITGDEAVLNDMGIMVTSENVALDNMSLIATTSLGSLITVTESNVNLTNLIISYSVGDDEAIAIDVRGAETISDINILNNSIYFESHVSNDEGYATAVNLEDVEDVIVDNNTIYASVPALYVETYDYTYFMMGLVYVNPIRIYEASGLEFTNNKVDVTINDCTASYPTAQAIYLVGSDDVLIKGNNFTMIDTATPIGTSIYLYAVECGFSDDISFVENNFNISTTGGKSGAGSAYALQVATSEVEILGNNITCDSNGPNLGIFSPYGFGRAKDMDIQNNFLNITGYVATNNDFGLISGIEIQTGYATIYNNTIYSQNKGDYDDAYPVSGISAVQYSASTLTFDVKDNEVYTNGKYAVEMLYPPQSAVVVGNTLYAYELTGDDAVYIKSGDNNEVHDNLPKALTNIVTNDTFFNFFDEDGMLLDTIEFDELIFQGEFSDLVDTIIISDEITLTGDNAVLNDIALSIIGDDVKVSGFTLNENNADFTNNGGAAIYVSGTDVTLDNVSVTYVAPSEVEAIAVYANGADNFALINSEIIYTSTNPGDKHNYGLKVKNCDEAIIDNNTINAVLPAVPVSWGGEGIDQDLVLAVGIQGGDDVEFTNNRVNVNTNGAIGSFPTVDAVMIHSANDILIKGNNITHVDTTTEDGARYYYSLDIYSTTGTVEGNNIIVNTTAGVDRAGTAYPIQLTGPATVTIKDNNLTAVSKGPTNAIYASNWAGAVDLTVENNNIDVYGYATTGNYALVSGIEAEIDVLKAYNNTIVVENTADYDDANQVYGISMASSWFTGDPSADIKDNDITVNGKYAVYYGKAINTNVTDNLLYGEELTGDDAVYIAAGSNNVVKDNLPYGGIIYVDVAGSDDNSGAIDAPVATIAKAVELALAGSGQIIVNEGTYDVPQVSVAGDLSITGNGTVVFEAQDATKKAFWITAGDVSITGVTFTNFNATYNGAVIRLDAGSLAIDNCNFIKNGGENRQALIQVKGADLTLTNTVFEENTASKTGTSYGNVYLTNNGAVISTLYAENVTFKNNHNKYGAFYLGSTIAAIYNSTFIGNNATSSSGGNGAAIYASGTATYISSYSGNLMNGSASYVLIEGCDFINNTAFGGTYYAGQGGAIYVNNNVTMFINDCLFENNSVMNTTGNDKPGQGGAIYASAGKVIVTKSIFKNNNAAEGPEIYMRYYNSHLHPEEVNTLNISNSIILNDGVAIVADSDNGTYVANDNWWGTNDEPADKVVNVTVDSWAKMDATLTPEGAYKGDVNVTATFDVELPDGINVTFTSTSGNLNTVVATVDGKATAAYTIDVTDTAITATSTDAVVEIPIIKPEAPIDIVADSVWIGNDANIIVTVPNATGTVTVQVNNVTKTLELVDGAANMTVAAADLETGINIVTVTYDGPDYAPNVVNDVIIVVDGVVTQDTYYYYFNQEDNGKLFDYIPDGATLDFQGSIINQDQSIVVQMNVNKPVNIVSTTGDAYVDLNTTAGSLLGESPGNSFAITYGGSGSNVTGINFHNTQLWFSNTHNVTLDNISNVVEDQRVGSGVGATSIRDNSSNVLLKNSYFYTRNNGGSTTFTFSWANNCTIDNCTVKAEGNVGNLIYLNIFNVAGAPSGVPLNNYNTVSNNRIYGKEGSSISVGLMVEGSHNLIVNNTLYKSSISTAFGGTNPNNNTYVNNTMTDGSGLTAQAYSIVYGNNVTGALSTGKGSVAYDNTVGGKLTVGQDANAYNNTVGNGLATGGTNAVIENNNITGAVTINKVGTNFIGNTVNGTVTVSANDNVIKGNNITTTGDYPVNLGAKTGNNVTDNYLVGAYYKGDAAVLFSNENNIVENNLPVVTINIDTTNVWIGNDANITVTVPNTTGGVVTVYVNNVTKTLQLYDGVANMTVSAADLETGINIVTVTYDGPEYGPAVDNNAIIVLDGVVTQDTYYYYFNQEDSGKLFDYIPEGVTLDFQGSIINEDQSVKIWFNVNKPVNIVSTTNDAYIDLNTTAGSLQGDNPGNRFTVSYGGSGSNITGLNFHNTQLWIANTHHVVLDNISNVIEDQRVGSGVGATSVRENCTYVTVKNSYFYTRNNGGSSSLVMAWADYCTFDNNTIVVEGNVGNMIYLTTFNVNVPSGVTANVHNNITNNHIYSPNSASAICWALVLSGSDNLIENNTVEYKGVGITTQFGSSTSPNNTYRGNVLLNGSSMSVLPDSIVYDNYVSGAITVGARSIVYNNTVGGKATINADAKFYNNTVGNGLATGATNTVIENNTITGAVTINKVGTTFIGNDVTGTVTVSANNNVIKENNIITTGAYAVDLGSKTGNNVTDNLLIASELKGDAAVKYSNENNIVENNRPYVTNFVVSADNITVGEPAIIIATVDEDATGTVHFIVNGKTYDAEVSEGEAQITVEDLTASDYTVTASFESDNIDYQDAENSTVFTVAKLETTVSIEVVNATLGEDAAVIIDVPGATGKVKVIVNGEETEIDLVDGQAVYTIEDIAAGDYNVVVIYSGDKNNDAQSNSTSFTVAKEAAEIKVSVPATEYSYDAVVTVELPEDATGIVFVDVGSNKYYAEVENGIATVTVPNVLANATVTARYAGDDKYDAMTNSTELVVTKMGTVLATDDLVMDYKDGSTFDVELYDSKGNPVSGARVYVNNTVNVYKYTTDELGVASVPVNLKVGEYTFTVIYDGSDIYEGFNTTRTVTVNKMATVISVEDITVTYKENENYAITVTDVNGKAVSGVTVNVDNGIKVLRYRTGADGVANVPITLKPGEYNFTISFDGNSLYEASNASSAVVVNKARANMVGSDLTVTYNDGSFFNVTLIDAEGNPISGVTVKFDNGVNAYRYHTDANGVASAPIKLKPGVYEYNISFAGNSIYAPNNITKTLTINKAAPKLEASNAEFTYKNGNLTAKLVDANGNGIASATLKFTQGNSTYKYHTDSDGIVSVPVNLKPGEYEYTISFDENAYYKAVNTTATVKVNMVDTVLTAEDITMTYKDGTNYTAKLTDAEGNALAGVVVKVNRTGSTYKYKTDSEGMISMPLNMKVGEYEIVAFIEDSDIYNPVSVTSTVTITK